MPTPSQCGGFMATTAISPMINNRKPNTLSMMNSAVEGDVVGFVSCCAIGLIPSCVAITKCVQYHSSLLGRPRRTRSLSKKHKGHRTRNISIRWPNVEVHSETGLASTFQIHGECARKHLVDRQIPLTHGLHNVRTHGGLQPGQPLELVFVVQCGRHTAEVVPRRTGFKTELNLF